MGKTGKPLHDSWESRFRIVDFRRIEPRPCPNCGAYPKPHRNRRSRYKYECNGDCWTQTHWCSTEQEARREWNNLKKRGMEDD